MKKHLDTKLIPGFAMPLASHRFGLAQPLEVKFRDLLLTRTPQELSGLLKVQPHLAQEIAELPIVSSGVIYLMEPTWPALSPLELMVLSSHILRRHVSDDLENTEPSQVFFDPSGQVRMCNNDPVPPLFLAAISAVKLHLGIDAQFISHLHLVTTNDLHFLRYFEHPHPGWPTLTRPVERFRSIDMRAHHFKIDDTLNTAANVLKSMQQPVGIKFRGYAIPTLGIKFYLEHTVGPFIAEQLDIEQESIFLTTIQNAKGHHLSVRGHVKLLCNTTQRRKTTIFEAHFR